MAHLTLIAAALIVVACGDDATETAQRPAVDDSVDNDAPDPDGPPSGDEEAAEIGSDEDEPNADPAERAAESDEDAELDAVAVACENDDMDACQELLRTVGATTEYGKLAREQLTKDTREQSGMSPDGTAAWPPRGFNEVTSDLAFKHVSGDIAPCRSGRRCVQYEVVARDGCARIYVEANLLDSDERVIGWTNDSLGSLPAGDVGMVELASYDTRMAQTVLTEVRCHR